MAPRVTPIELTDLQRLAELDRAYAATAATEAIVDRASVHYFQRTGHSFVASGPAGEALGFVLAHASWSGGRPVVRLERLAVTGAVETEGAEPGVGEALVEAVLKSAYDSGVYDISAVVPRLDARANAALRGAAFQEQAVRFYYRVLGSRGAAGQDSSATLEAQALTSNSSQGG